ncbi:Inosine/uridine-preferring nucleoside hydrolase domain-containing protein [Scenedesmus sp. NREL 46B-D3]|nr:Inosine/uridine-preferring nucleoside hydrolase domain-containing protein [Scenedesmus sp. NREL 46B-D3]
MATMMALNHPTLNVLSIIPIFGNTDLASEMLVTQWLVGQLKQQPDVPVVPGAVSPPLPLLIQPPALYFDNSTAGEHTAGETSAGDMQHQRQQELLQHQTQGTQQQQQQQQPHHQLDLLQLFKAGCPNLGVHQMKTDLEAAAARGRTVHIAVLGPTTDVACLLAHWPDLAQKAVEAVVFLGSQPAGA